MADRIVLHIGTYKTGTTAIQRSLGQAFGPLLERGILYPRAGRRGPGHARLARELVDTTTPVSEVPSHLRIVEEVRARGATALVISAEDLSVPKPRLVRWAQTLCEQMGPRELRIVAYVRPQWEYIESHYAELIKNGRRWGPIEQYVESSLERPYLFDYPKVFGDWREAFGEQLDIRPYGAEHFVDGDVVKDFWRATDLGPAPRPQGRSVNRRTGAMTTEMLRTLRGLLADYGLDRFVPAADVLRLARLRLEAELPDDPPFRGLTPELVGRIAETFSASNHAFVRDYLGGRDAGLFEPPGEIAPATARWSPHEASEWELRLFTSVVEDALSAARAPRRARLASILRPGAREAVARSVADWAGERVDLLSGRLRRTGDEHKRD